MTRYFSIFYYIINIMFLKIMTLISFASFLLVAKPFKPVVSFNNDNITKDYNVIIIIQQQIFDPESQFILFSLLKKLPNQITFQSFDQIINNLINQQKFISTYRHKNELYQPVFNSIHQYRNYSLRFNKNSLNSERRIISNTFKALDKFVVNEKKYRPICLIIDLPAKVNYSLNRHSLNNTSTFESRRDFLLVNLYHEIHSRQYLFPNKLIIFPTMDSNPIIINNF